MEEQHFQKMPTPDDYLARPKPCMRLAKASTPAGQRPFRVILDPASDGSEVRFAIMDRVDNEFLPRIGYALYLHASPSN